MSQYIQGKDGKFAGSIGSGKSAVPTPSDVPVLTPEPLPARHSDESIRAARAAFQAKFGERSATDPDAAYRDPEAAVAAAVAEYRGAMEAEEPVGWVFTSSSLRGLPTVTSAGRMDETLMFRQEMSDDGAFEESVGPERPEMKRGRIDTIRMLRPYDGTQESTALTLIGLDDEGRLHNRRMFSGKHSWEIGPAVFSDGRAKYYQHGKLHRTDGPAIVEPDYKAWARNGRVIAEMRDNDGILRDPSTGQPLSGLSGWLTRRKCRD